MKSKRSAIRFRWVSGLKQDPQDLDFEITPCLTFAHCIEPKGTAWGLYVKWGYWAYGIGLYKFIN